MIKTITTNNLTYTSLGEPHQYNKGLLRNCEILTTYCIIRFEIYHGYLHDFIESFKVYDNASSIQLLNLTNIKKTEVSKENICKLLNRLDSSTRLNDEKLDNFIKLVQQQIQQS